ncbi:MAG: tRNA (adenosine(37)-N6)-threonylcarbamoyltransferase complex ATPase subunit type 1 TsaE [Chitinophagales bacterium]|nr:MAG: tRNA (adenosine(37)-N6)-threonylcarbamoyltransferase complex ATPase subunit type 1 TsaE [Chitinophagales bacterium]
MSKELSLHQVQENQLQEAARQILEYCKNRIFFAFYGEIGAGKTTLIKAICLALGCKDAISSPSFSLINEYHLQPGLTPERIYHIDLYRLESIREALDIGLQEIFHSSQYCFVEWPQVAETFFPDTAVRIYLSINADNSRTIRICL